MQSKIQSNSIGKIGKTTPLKGFLGKLIITKEVQDQIDYLHGKVIGKEWGGVFTYTTEGNIKDLANMVFTVHNIYLMDIGTYAHTGYSYEGFSKIYKTIPNTDLDIRIGGIHTHHTMGAFFSGEDMNEIATNSPIYDYYLSLVVDTRGTYKAKVGIPVVEEKSTATIKDGQGGTHTINIKQDNNNVFVIDVDVETALVNVDIPKWFQDRFTELEAIKKPIIPVNTYGYMSGTTYVKPTANQLPEKTVLFVCKLLRAFNLYDAISYDYIDVDLEEIENVLCDHEELVDLIYKVYGTSVTKKEVYDTLNSAKKLLEVYVSTGYKSLSSIIALLDIYAREYSS